MLVVLAFGLAIVAAVRSTWSPCGLSMLSTVTPIAERGRGHRFGVTAAWFVVGSVLGGATLGAVAALGAVPLGGVPTEAALAIAGVLALVGALVDAGVGGIRPPFFKRQLDDAWLDRYRGWVYGLGFGWQIGAGVATYIMTTAVLVSVALAGLTGDAGLAFLVGVTFGLVRGLAILGSAPATTTAALGRLHQRFETLEAPVRQATVVALATSGFVALAAVSPWALLAGVAAVAVGVVAHRSRRPAAAAEPAVPA